MKPQRLYIHRFIGGPMHGSTHPSPQVHPVQDWHGPVYCQRGEPVPLDQHSDEVLRVNRLGQPTVPTEYFAVDMAYGPSESTTLSPDPPHEAEDMLRLMPASRRGRHCRRTSHGCTSWQTSFASCGSS